MRMVDLETQGTRLLWRPRRNRSADFQSAVSQASSLPAVASRRLAIRQAGCLRYGACRAAPDCVIFFP